MERHNLNRQLSTKNIVWATQLKALGLHGMGGEEGFMAMALNFHFKCEGPAGWHFTCPSNGGSKSRSAVGDRQRIAREVALLKKPVWFRTPLLDVLAQGLMVLCKTRIPRPELFLFPKEELRAHRERGMIQRVARMHELADEKFDPRRLPLRLWQQLGVNVQSLPTYLRPGARAR